MRLRAEFTTEPFEGEGDPDPPAHAVVAREALRESGLEPEFGPLGTAISGDRAVLLPALSAVLERTLDAGADRITLQVSIDDTPRDG
ncbi:thiamine-binding protein [Actinopolyspora sp. H202]|uniref:thiamine-binding protein n=1 Tax=Actinopolyspora sp. H202 TaxID=1500456 RepID=UPI003EE701CF